MQIDNNKDIWARHFEFSGENKTLSDGDQSSNHTTVLFTHLCGRVCLFKLRFMAYEVVGIFKHMPNEVIGSEHVVLANVLAGICFWTYYKACNVSPGELNKINEKKFVKKY